MKATVKVSPEQCGRWRVWRIDPPPLESHDLWRYSGEHCFDQTVVKANDSRRAFTYTPHVRMTTTGEPQDLTDVPPTPITHLSETESMMAESVSKFAAEVIAPRVREMDEAEKMDPEIIERCFEQGLMSVEIPEEYGGAGMNFTAAIVGIEELARVDPSVSVMVDVHNTLVNTAILKYGTKESQRKWLPKLATNVLGSFCLSEPASGSDAFALKTARDQDERRASSSSSPTSTQQGIQGHHGLHREKDTPGFAIAKKEKKLGIKASSTCVLTFDDVKIPHDHLLGKEGDGYKYAIGILNEGRPASPARYVWLDREQFGQKVGTFQSMQHQLAQAYTEITAARHLLYNAARLKECGKDFVREAAMAKLYSSQVAGRVAGLAVEWMGGMGFVREGTAEKMYRDAKIGAIYEGTSNIQLQTIAKLLEREYTR
ncbi:hypothetical protein MRB53_041392 [Persea americana]|nr:hypothetical protein MRB53_041392 [Persea americana]